MSLSLLLQIVGYSTASLISLCGIAILIEFIPLVLPTHFRITFGIVLLLYGIYRIVTLWSKSKQNANE
ncbi:MAG: hypothetical protein FJ218_00760 [Ignavibacteria bacterium]|nr:hypothetical protein [Ignavibacteria bacterium]